MMVHINKIQRLHSSCPHQRTYSRLCTPAAPRGIIKKNLARKDKKDTYYVVQTFGSPFLPAVETIPRILYSSCPRIEGYECYCEHTPFAERFTSTIRCRPRPISRPRATPETSRRRPPHRARTSGPRTRPGPRPAA